MEIEKILNIENESELVRKAQKGDQRAFSLLVKKYESTVYSFAYKVCRNEEKAAETLQDTFVNVYRKLDQFNGKAKFSTWLYQIVTNNCLMKRRKSKLDKSSVSLESPDSAQEECLLLLIHPVEILLEFIWVFKIVGLLYRYFVLIILHRF